LHSLAKQVCENKGRAPLTLVEFARSDLVAALQVFGDEMLSSSQVIHVQASNAVRARRLETRAQPPRIQVTNPTINVLVSDNHRLPSTAANSLYRTDDFGRLQTHPSLAGRIHHIENEDDDPTLARLDDKLDGFVEDILLGGDLILLRWVDPGLGGKLADLAVCARTAALTLVVRSEVILQASEMSLDLV